VVRPGDPPPAPRRHEVKSTIDRLPPAVRAELWRLRTEEGRTHGEITAWLNGQGHAVSSRAVARHLHQLERDVATRVRIEMARLSPTLAFAQQFAGAVVSAAAGADRQATLGALAELLKTRLVMMARQDLERATRAAAAPDDTLPEGAGEADGAAGDALPDEPLLSMKELFAMARTIQTLEQAQRTEAQRLSEAEEQERRRQEREQAAARVDAVVKKSRGLSAETVAAIRHAVLGDA
jgi:hypothetical protein